MLMCIYIYIYIYGGVLKLGIPEADGLFHGKANIKMDAIWGCILGNLHMLI